MRHKKLGRKLGVKNKHRKAMFRNMATDLFRYDSIKTTDTRAKEIRRVAEKIVTLAKDGSLQARRRAASFIRDKEVLSKIFSSVAERYKDRPGGYTRIIKLGYRRGDNSPISMIELVKEDYKPSSRKKSKKSTSGTDNDRGSSKQTKSKKKESARELGLSDQEDTEASVTTQQETEGINETTPGSEKKKSDASADSDKNTGSTENGDEESGQKVDPADPEEKQDK